MSAGTNEAGKVLLAECRSLNILCAVDFSFPKSNFDLKAVALVKKVTGQQSIG